MKLGTFQENNGNGKVTLTSDNLKFACAELGINADSHTLRRAARAFDLYRSGKVEHVNNHTFQVASQYDRQRPYQVTLHEGATKMYGYCTCQDWMNYSGDMDVPDVNFWCKHMISAALWLHSNGNGNGNGNGSKITNDCGSKRAEAIQAKLNGQVDSRNDNGNGANKAPSLNIDPSAKPFMESDELDAKQIETGEGGNVHHLSNGRYVIAFNGIMHLADKHGILTETWADSPSEGFVTVKAMRNDTMNIRKSVQPVNGSFEVAEGKARRNACRMLIPLQELRALECKAMLESEFSWEAAKAKCVELVGDANVAIIIHELVNAGKLRPDNPSHYDRTEWIIIHKACQEDAEQGSDNDDGGGDTPSSSHWHERYQQCVKVSSIQDTRIAMDTVLGWRARYRKDLISDEDWDKVFEKCQELRATYERIQQAKGERRHLIKQAEYDYIRDRTGYDVQSKKYVGRPPLNTDEFVDRCKEAIQKVRDSKVSEANEQPLQSEGSRKLQMDKKLRTWLIESDGTKKAISCREICEKFDANIVTRLRAGINSGADISTVEIE